MLEFVIMLETASRNLVPDLEQVPAKQATGMSRPWSSSLCFFNMDNIGCWLQSVGRWVNFLLLVLSVTVLFVCLFVCLFVYSTAYSYHSQQQQQQQPNRTSEQKEYLFSQNI